MKSEVTHYSRSSVSSSHVIRRTDVARVLRHAECVSDKVSECVSDKVSECVSENR